MDERRPLLAAVKVIGASGVPDRVMSTSPLYVPPVTSTVCPGCTAAAAVCKVQ